MNKVVEVAFDLNKGWDAVEPQPNTATGYQCKYYYTNSIDPNVRFRSAPAGLDVSEEDNIPCDGVGELEKILLEGARKNYIKKFHLPPDWKFAIIGIEKDDA